MDTWYTVAEGREVHDIVSNGGTIADVARRFGVSWTTAQRAVKRLGIRIHYGGQYNPDLRAAILSYLSRGPAACAEIGRSMTPPRCKEAVNRIVRELKAAGLVRRTGRTKGTRFHLTRKWSHADSET